MSMTREEAITRLKCWLSNGTDGMTSDRAGYIEGWFVIADVRAFDMAIEALKEMSAEEYRQRLMEVFHQTDHDELITFVVQPKEEEFKSLEYILQKQPFEPRPHGMWIIVDDCERFIAKCSVCGRIEDSRLVKNYPFCRCGADMREGDEK